MRIVRGIQYLRAALHVRTLEADLAEQKKCRAAVSDPTTRAAQFCRLEQVRRELAKARAELVASYPPGVRLTWGDA